MTLQTDYQYISEKPVTKVPLMRDNEVLNTDLEGDKCSVTLSITK